MIVVDTSAMVRLVLGGPDGEGGARLLLRDPEWAAPPVLLSELRNVLLGLVRQGSLILDQARAMCDDAARVLGPRQLRGMWRYGRVSANTGKRT